MREAIPATHLVFDPGGPAEPEDRMRAAWDDALTSGGLAAELANGFEDPGERALARVCRARTARCFA